MEVDKSKNMPHVEKSARGNEENMELWDLYDAERHYLARTIARGAAHPAGTYHLVVNIWVVNSNGELLVTLRAPEKEQYPNLWENQGGSAQAGEESLDAAKRELFEETGICMECRDFTLLGTSLEKTAMVDIYAVRKDIAVQDIRLQTGETVAAKWVSPRELDIMAVAGQMSDATMRRRMAVLSAWKAFIGGNIF